jgi:hypothetical protein
MAYHRKTRREKLADDKGLPKIAKIEGKLSKRWGSGTMVIPDPREVDAMIRTIRKGRTATINNLRAMLAKKHGVDICCHDRHLYLDRRPRRRRGRSGGQEAHHAVVACAEVGRETESEVSRRSGGAGPTTCGRGARH